MEKIVLAAASFEKEKYFFNDQFDELPESVKKDVKVITVVLANSLMCTMVMGFYETGDIYFEAVKGETASDFDDIGAELEIKALQKEKAEFIESLRLWYLVFNTEKGQGIKDMLLKKD